VSPLLVSDDFWRYFSDSGWRHGTSSRIRL
jgi:hypothetical protein